MCGIVGWVNFNTPPSREIVEKMNQRLIHRGPDFGSVLNLGPAVFGHRRLSIIDLSEISNQPFLSVCGEFSIVFNGEIYNYQDLRRELSQYGASFKSEGDAEVILEAYKRWGIEFLKKLNGMFAFAIWDLKANQLLLARDRLGEKPLYYSFDKNGGLFF